MAVDLAIHAPSKDGDSRNYHAHMLATTRKWEDGVLTDKADIERENKALKAAGLDISQHQIEDLRFAWEVMTNQALQAAGHDVRIVGPAATAMERRGVKTDLGDINREIMAMAAPAPVPTPATQPQPKQKPKTTKKQPRPIQQEDMTSALGQRVQDSIYDYLDEYNLDMAGLSALGQMDALTVSWQAIRSHQPELDPDEQAEALARAAIHVAANGEEPSEADPAMALSLLASIAPTLPEDVQDHLTSWQHEGKTWKEAGPLTDPEEGISPKPWEER